MIDNFHEYEYEFKYFKNVLEYMSTAVLSTSAPGLTWGIHIVSQGHILVLSGAVLITC